MKSRNKVIYTLVGILSALLLVLLVSCGNSNTAPYNATITFSPNAISYGIVGDICVNSAVTVKYSDGTPMPGAALIMSGAFAFPRVPSHYTLYSAPCPPDPGNLQDGNGFTAVTDDSGTFYYSVVVSAASGTFTDNINAFSGSVYGTQAITIN